MSRLLWIQMGTVVGGGQELPLEVGLRFTDEFGNETESSPETLVIWEDSPEYTDALDNASGITRHMLKSSGIWDELNDSSENTWIRDGADDELVAFLESNDVKRLDGETYLISYNLTPQVMNLLSKSFPNFYNAMPRDVIDVAQLNDLCVLLNPYLEDNIEDVLDKLETPRVARAQDNIDMMIARYMLYVENFLIVGDEE